MHAVAAQVLYFRKKFQGTALLDNTYVKKHPWYFWCLSNDAKRAQHLNLDVISKSLHLNFLMKVV